MTDPNWLDGILAGGWRRAEDQEKRMYRRDDEERKQRWMAAVVIARTMDVGERGSEQPSLKRYNRARTCTSGNPFVQMTCPTMQKSLA